MTRPLEEQLASTEGVISLQSETSEGRSAINLSFPYGYDVDMALREASTRLDRAKRLLPDTIQAPTVFKLDPSQNAVVTVAISSPLRDAVELRSWVDHSLSKWFVNLPGVAAAEVGGGLIREIQILPDLRRMISLGITLEEITQSVQRDHVDTPIGRLYLPSQELSSRVIGRFSTVDQLATVRLSPVYALSSETLLTSSKAAYNTVINRPYLGEVARIVDTHEEQRLEVRFNEVPSIKMSLQKQPEANAVKVAETILQRIDWLNAHKNIPEDLQLAVVDNQAIYVKRALANAVSAAISGAGLAMLVVYLFLGNWQSTLIIGTAIPLAVTVTLILMVANGLTLNIMTLGGLALGVGMVVDNTIVMLENITRHQQQSTDSQAGALTAVHEITSALIASSTTNLAAILPFLFIVGLVGLLFRELIFTIAVAMLASLLVSLTVVPALAAHRTQSTVRTAWLAILERKLNHLYTRLLRILLQGPSWVIALFSIGLILSLQHLFSMKEIFLPEFDEGRVQINVLAEPGLALTEMNQLTQQLEHLLKQQPSVDSIFVEMGGMIYGRSQYEASHRSQLMIQLQPANQRDLSTDQWIKQFNEQLAKLEWLGVKLRVSSRGLRGIRVGNTEEQFDLKIQGLDLPTLTHLANQMLTQLENIPGLNNLKHSAEEIQQEMTIVVNKQRAELAGFHAQTIGRYLNTLLNGQTVTHFIEGEQQIAIKLRLPRQQLADLQAVQDLPLYNSAGITYRLSELATLRWAIAPTEIKREQQQRILQITGDIAKDTDLTTLNTQVEKYIANFQLPAGYTLYRGGVTQALQENQHLTQALLGLAVFLVWVVMVVQYESLRNPLIILFSIPFALIGVTWGLYWLDLPLSMPVWLGIIMLAGIVVNNAIILVETIEQQRLQTEVLSEAIVNSAALRLRPILMTTLTTVIGLIPLSLGWSQGSEMLQPLAVTIVFGLSFSLLVSLLLVPMTYYRLTI